MPIAPIAGAIAANQATRRGGGGVAIGGYELLVVIAVTLFAFYALVTVVTWLAELDRYGDKRTLVEHLRRQVRFVRLVVSRLW